MPTGKSIKTPHPIDSIRSLATLQTPHQCKADHNVINGHEPTDDHQEWAQSNLVGTERLGMDPLNHLSGIKTPPLETAPFAFPNIRP